MTRRRQGADELQPVLPIHKRVLLRMFLAMFGPMERLGVHITPVHFYYPIPDTSRLASALWTEPSAMRGIDLRVSAQERLLSECESLRDEYDAIPFVVRGDELEFQLDNPFFGPVDAEMLYCLIRLRRPRRIIEIGGGHSTLLALKALARNAAEAGAASRLQVIEPFPTDPLRRALVGRGELIAEPVQSIGVGLFEELDQGDIVFIDSSHVVSIGSDVCFEILELLPRLSPGVLVHFHDIYLPWQYPRDLFTRLRRFWTEQYLLQAFLALSSAYEVVWAGHFMHRSRAEGLRRAFRSYREHENVPGSFWIRRVS